MSANPDWNPNLDVVTAGLTGKVVASVPGFHWPNIATHLALVEWQWKGMADYGESQDVHWNDYVYHCGQIES